MLEAIAAALRLDGGATAHLFSLADTTPRRIPDTAARIDPATRRVLEALAPMPACVIDTRLDVLAQNRPSELLFGSTRSLPPGRRNNLWLAYTEPYWRSLLADWDEESAHLIALYRSALAEHLGEPSWQAMIDELHDLSAGSVPAGRNTGWRCPAAGPRSSIIRSPGARFRTTSHGCNRGPGCG